MRFTNVSSVFSLIRNLQKHFYEINLIQQGARKIHISFLNRMELNN